MVLGASVSTFAVLSNQTGLQTPAGISWAAWESMCLFNFHLWSYLMITFPSSDQSIGHSLRRLLLCAICGYNCSVYRPDLFPLTTWVKNDGDYTRLTHPHAHTYTLTHVQFFSTLPLLWSRPLPPPVEMPLVDSSSLFSSRWTSELWEILALHWLLITIRTWSHPFTSIQRPFMSLVSISLCSFPTSSSSHLRLNATYSPTELPVTCSPTYGPSNKRFSLTGTLFFSFFSHSLFPFSLLFYRLPSSLNLNLTTFRRHSQATHPEEAPCLGVPVASSPFPVKTLGALCCSCLLTFLFPIPLHWEDNQLSNHVLFIDKAPMSRIGLAYSRHSINAYFFKIFFLLMWTIFYKVSIEFVTVLFLFYVLFFWPHYNTCGILVTWPGIELALAALEG